MVKVKFEGTSGAELRQQMLDFLGLTLVSAEAAVKEVFSQETTTSVKEETTVEVDAPAPKRKSRAKTEKVEDQPEVETPEDTGSISRFGDNMLVEDAETVEKELVETVEKAAEVGEKEIEEAKEEPKAEVMTRAQLTEVVLSKGREGKKPQLIAAFGNFKNAEGGAVSGLPTLKPEDYQAFHDAIVNL